MGGKHLRFNQNTADISWFDVQKNDVTRFHHGETCRGNWSSALDPDIDLVNEYMTQQALRRLGF